MTAERDSRGFAYDFFISRRGDASEVAAEIARILESEGYKTLTQDLDFSYGDNFVQCINGALSQCRNFIAVLTRDYETSKYTKAEWTAFFALSSSDGDRRLALLRVEDFQPSGLLAPYVYGDLVRVGDPARRRDIILDAARGRAPGPRPSGALAPPPKIFRGVPLRNLGFVGRGDMLDEVDRALASGKQTAAITQAAIYGLGGIGKTSLAAEYVYQNMDRYAGVWWASGESRTLLIESLAELGQMLNPQGSAIYEKRDKIGVAEILAKSALARLSESQTPWLLVYDNVKDPDDIRDLVPSGGARILITTRWTNWYGRAVPVEVDLLSEDEAVDLLLRITESGDRKGAARLADTLGYLPLALDHAGAYIRLTAMSFEQYGKRAADLIAKAPKGVNYPNSVSATFGLAIEQAISGCAGAKDLLAFFSVLAPDQIPVDLADDAILPEDQRAEALYALRGVSLVQYEADEHGGRSVFIHRLVRAAMRTYLKTSGDTGAVIRSAIARLAQAFPDKGYGEPACWPACMQLLPHALALCEEAARAKIETAELAHLIDSAACYLLGRGAFAHAEPLFRDTIAIGKRVLGAGHRNIGVWENNLGNLLLNSGRYKEAIHHYRRAIAIGVQTLGRDHPNLATRLNNLAKAFVRVGRHKDAEELFRAAIRTAEKSFGRENHVVATRMHALANLLRDTRRAAEAEPLYREAIAIGERTLGRDHSRVCDWLNDLAELLRDRGEYEEAEKLYREGIEKLTKSLGAQHMNVAFARENFAVLLLLTGRVDDAHREASLAVSIHTESFGPDHKWTTGAVEVLCKVLEALGRHDEALRLGAPGGAMLQAG